MNPCFLPWIFLQVTLLGCFASVGSKPDSNGFAVMMTLERLEPGMGRIRTGQSDPGVIGNLDSVKYPACWALSKEVFIIATATTGAL